MRGMSTHSRIGKQVGSLSVRDAIDLPSDSCSVTAVATPFAAAARRFCAAPGPKKTGMEMRQ